MEIIHTVILYPLALPRALIKPWVLSPSYTRSVPIQISPWDSIQTCWVIIESIPLLIQVLCMFINPLSPFPLPQTKYLNIMTKLNEVKT